MERQGEEDGPVGEEELVNGVLGGGVEVSRRRGGLGSKNDGDVRRGAERRAVEGNESPGRGVQGGGCVGERHNS